MTNFRNLKMLTVFSALVMCISLLPVIARAGDSAGKYRFGFIGGPNSYTEFKVGFLNPKATSSSVLFGLETGSQVDEAVSVGLEIDFWRKVFEKKIDVGVDTSSTSITTRTKLLYRHTVYYIPILGTLKFNVPMGVGSPISPFAGVSGGYAFSHIGYKYNDSSLNQTNVTEAPDKGYYGGWNWRIFGGAGLTLGSMSKLNVALMYNGATVKKSESGGIERELDLGGFGMYASISLMGF